ncbi:DUF6388 family protein [Acinetobacter ursingii]|uniref:DUF6388 family protein n=1 Tax=Acinetobacter ursingii TaxID=108980 RepID=UPI003AF5999E
MTINKSENRLAYEKQMEGLLQKAYDKFGKNENVRAHLDSLNPKTAEAVGITFEEYRHQTLLELFSKQAKILNKDGIDYAIEMVLPVAQASALKELRIQIHNENIQ